MARVLTGILGFWAAGCESYQTRTYRPPPPEPAPQLEDEGMYKATALAQLLEVEASVERDEALARQGDREAQSRLLLNRPIAQMMRAHYDSMDARDRGTE